MKNGALILIFFIVCSTCLLSKNDNFVVLNSTGIHDVKLGFRVGDTNCSQFNSLSFPVNEIAWLAQDTIDFGRVCVGSQKEASFILQNSQNPMLFNGIFTNSNFLFADNSIKTVFAPNESKTIEIIYTAIKDTGLIIDTLIITDESNFKKYIILKVEPIFIDIVMSQSLDFDTVCAGLSKVRSFEVRSISSVSASFSAKIESDYDQFQMRNNPFAQRFLPDEHHPLDILFNAGNIPGEHSGTLTLIDTCGNEHYVYFYAEIPEAVLSRVVDVVKDTVQPGVAITKEVRFVNTGLERLFINNISGIQSPFKFKSTNRIIPGWLNILDTLIVFVEFNADIKGTYSNIIKASGVLVCPFGDSSRLQMDVGIVVANSSIKIGSPIDKIPPGQEIKIPINLLASHHLLQSGIKDWEARISFNKFTLIPIDEDIIGDRFLGDRREITIGGSVGITEGTLHDIKFIAALGNEECSDIRIDGFEWFGGEYVIDTLIDGNVCFKICEEGGKRLLNLTERIELEIVGPNPADDFVSIKLNLIESGEHELSLINSLGRKTYSEKLIIDSGLLKTEKKIYLGNLAGGSYVLVLRTPTEVWTRRVEVVR